jgi:putative ABC transport system permease protein
MSATDTLEAGGRPAASWLQGLPLALRLALRELRGGIRGFYVFIACVALGVMVITAVGALSDAMRSGFERQGKTILGGDAVLSRMHKRIEPEERAFLDRQGRVSETATMRTMARKLDGSDQSLAEVKAVDAAYPLVGEVKLEGKGKQPLGLVDALAGNGAALDPILMERLGLAIGDRFSMGSGELVARAAITAEPDGIADRLTFGPRILVSHATLASTGLVQPGALVRWRYAVLQGEESLASLLSLRDAVKTGMPDAGFTVADRRDPSPQVTRTLERLRQFLTLIGLTSLLIGGVGVANAVATFIDRRRKVIATLKSVGASSRLVLSIFLIQVMSIACIGILIGLVLGYIVPVVLNGLYGSALPIRAEISVEPWSVVSATAYGLLVALLFTLWPLGRAELIGAASLFRDEVEEEKQRWPRPLIIGATLACLVGLAALAILASDSRKIAAWFCLALLVVFAVFGGLGVLVTHIARRTARPAIPELAIAIGNLGAPGGLTRSVVMSLGAGLSLLVAVALADASLVAEMTSRLPAQSPNYFVLDVVKGDYPGLVERVQREVPGAKLDQAPMLRGRLVRLNGTPVEEIKAPPEAQWVLTGDRGLTYADDVPEGSKVVEGSWWAKDYAGEPLVSFEQELARKLGLKIGDSVTVNVLGRNLTAKIASLREVKWESLAINFVLVFSPNTLRAAPHNVLATVLLPKDAPLEAEARVARAITQAYPAVTAIRVKDAINAFAAIFAKLVVATRVAGSVTLIAGALVLAGALVTAQRRRIQQAVILKALGATRRRIITSHLLEYLIAAAVTAVFAIAIGSLTGYIALTQVMDVEFTFSWLAVIQALGLAAGLVVAFGAAGTWQVLRSPAVPYLRSQ